MAREIGGEIISMDSRQAYAGFRIGTAAPGPEELAAVRHHGVGFLDPGARYGAGRFVRRYEAWSAGIRARGHVPVLAGGTGLFLRALTHPVFEEPRVAPERRARVRAWLAGAGDRLVTWATRLDPGLASGGPPDPQRAERTVELALLTGRPLSWWIEHGPPTRPPLRALVVALDLPGDELRGRIAGRIAAWLDSGAWEREVEGLVAKGLEGSAAFDALGYREVLALARGAAPRAEVQRTIEAATWAYARRQRTWFRHQLPDTAVRLDGLEPTDQLSRRIVALWRGRGNREDTT